MVRLRSQAAEWPGFIMVENRSPDFSQFSPISSIVTGMPASHNLRAATAPP